MNGTVTSMGEHSERAIVTPQMATEFLEKNRNNRPLSDGHVKRIAGQIASGKWKFNGDTIKVADTGDILDGQHRLWAVIEAKASIDTIIVRGIQRDAFATIDTIRRTRTGGDVVALLGVEQYRTTVASALQWLLRWQRGVMRDWRAPSNKIENSDIEAAMSAHPTIVDAARRAVRLRSIGNPSILTFLYYILASRNEDLADRMMETLERPAGVAMDDPFFMLRQHLTAARPHRSDPVGTIALAIKAMNAADDSRSIRNLSWRTQGAHPESFPILEVRQA